MQLLRSAAPGTVAGKPVERVASKFYFVEVPFRQKEELYYY